jgi:hypothetical protein
MQRHTPQSSWADFITCVNIPKLLGAHHKDCNWALLFCLVPCVSCSKTRYNIKLQKPSCGGTGAVKQMYLIFTLYKVMSNELAAL